MPASSPSDLTVTAKVQLGVLSPWKRCQISFNSRSGILRVDGRAVTLRGCDVSHSRKGTSIIPPNCSFSRGHSASANSLPPSTTANNNNSVLHHHYNHNHNHSHNHSLSTAHNASGNGARGQIITLAPCTPTTRAAWKKFSVGLTLASRSPEGFCLLRELGSGASGVVYEAYICDHALRARLGSEGEHVALKLIPKAQINDCQAELNNAKLDIARHKSLLMPLHMFLTATHMVIVMPLIVGGSLLEKMQSVQGGYPFSEKFIRKIIYDVLSAVKVLHANNLAHRDIKLENILVEKHEAYLCDLGLVAKVPKHGFIHAAGTTYIQAPEIGGYTRYGKQCDIWSIGVVLLILLRKGIPFVDDNHRNQLLKEMRNSNDPLAALLSAKRRKALSHTLLNLLRGLLAIDPAKRLTVSDALNHPYFTDIENEWPGDSNPEFARRLKKKGEKHNNKGDNKNNSDCGALGKMSFVTLAIVRLRFMRAINRMRRNSNASSRASIISIEAAPHTKTCANNGRKNNNKKKNRNNNNTCFVHTTMKRFIGSLCGMLSSTTNNNRDNTSPPNTSNNSTSFFGDCTSSGTPSPSNSPPPAVHPPHRRWSLNLNNNNR